MTTSEGAPAAPWPAPIGIVGRGAVGVALARALRAHGVPAWLGDRAPARPGPADLPPALALPDLLARCGLVLLAVPDGAIRSVAAGLAWRPGQWVAHCAGSLPASVLAAEVAPALAGAWHPLAAFPPWRDERSGNPAAFAGIIVAVDGPAPVAAGLAALATRLGARPLAVPEAARSAYHLAAALFSNGIVALAAEAAAVWSAAGLAGELALPALLPLGESTLTNLSRVGLPAALSGPIARGDVATVARHLAVLRAQPDGAATLALYRALSQPLLALAATQGRARPADLAAIAALLAEA